MKKIITIILILVIIPLGFSSCDLQSRYSHNLPEGYTGGFRISNSSPVEYYWVETYEEAIAAIELLKSHGGTICESIVISNDSEQYDIKYCFTFNVTKADWIEFGENPFDRYAQDVKVASYVFADEVTIDELVYSDIFTYNVFQLIIHKDYPDKKDLEFINIDTMECEFFPDELNTRTFVYVDGELVFSIASLIPYTQLSEDVVRDVISSLKVVK